ncbi:MAG: hypothetical protein EXS08_15030 [Planctomycetes bacterium]|nr:hypothetical protein [Planctomycetota bacterium]
MSAALELELLGVPVVLESAEPEILERLRVCYALSLRANSTVRPLRARLEHVAHGFRVLVDSRPERAEPDAVAAVRALNHELLQALMQRCRAHYFVHAAVLVHGGRALVLPGLSRAGKSTLALALVLEGARFLSDELLCYTDVGRAEALPRALKIRDECVGYFPELATRFVGSGEGRFLPFEALPRDVLAEPAPIGAVIVPRWMGDGQERLTPTSRGEALLALAAASLNFGAHREISLDWLAELVDEAQVFALAWSDPRAAARGLLAELAR